MGYSHYWYTTNINPDIISGVRKNVIDEIEILINILEYDRTKSIINLNNNILIIERVEDEPDHSETFIFDFNNPIRRGGFLHGFDSCKTNRTPKIDMLVMLTLLSLGNNIHNFTIRTDGDIEDWQPAIDLYEKHIRCLTFNFEEMIKDD